MKSLQNSDIRLTDAMERRLLQEAIDAQYDDALVRAVRGLFKRISATFKSSKKVNVPHGVRTAH